LNVIFETDVLHHVLSSSKLKNIDNLNDRVISISDCNMELFSYNNSKSSITTKLVLHIKKFDLAGGNEKANGTPRNINYDPKIFFMIQEFFHRSYKKSSKPTKKVASLDADAIINKSFSGKFDSIRKTYDEKSGVNIGNNKKIEDGHLNQIHLTSGNKNCDDVRNEELRRIVREEDFFEEYEEDMEEESNKGIGKKKEEYPNSLQALMEKYSNVIPTIKKGTILKFKSLKEQNEGN